MSDLFFNMTAMIDYNLPLCARTLCRGYPSSFCPTRIWFRGLGVIALTNTIVDSEPGFQKGWLGCNEGILDAKNSKDGFLHGGFLSGVFINYACRTELHSRKPSLVFAIHIYLGVP